MNQKKIRTLRANSDIRQNIVTFDSSVSSSSNIEEAFLLQSAVTNAQGKAVISEVKNGTYSLEVLATDYNEVYNQTNLVVTSNKDVLINITPLYGVTIQVKNSSAANIEGAVVKLTPSNGIQETKNTDVNGQAIFTAVPGGVYTIEISKENYQTVSTGGVIEGGETVTFDYTLAIMSKLVQITSNQSNYQLDTTYKYVSMLVVGKGVRFSGSYGGGSGMIIYKKNFEISSFYEGQIDQIQFSKTTTYDPKITGTSVLMSLDRNEDYVREICAQDALNQNGADTLHYTLGPTDITFELDGYGSNGGGGYIRTSGTVVGYAGGGSNGDADGDIPGVGGDGKFGYKGGGSNAGIGITKGTIIPLTSIFSGTGKGGRGSASLGGGGAGGYSDGNIEVTGYGNGLAAGASYTQSQGIVCLYYHNEPI